MSISIHLRHFVILLLISLVSCAGAQNKLEPGEFNTQLSQDSTAVLVDVRTPSEFNEGHLENALNIDWKDDSFETRVKELDRTKTYYLYCRSGRRSAAAASRMNKLGFTRVFDLDGGIIEWKEEGLPTTSEED